MLKSASYSALYIGGKRMDKGYVKSTQTQTHIKYEGYFLYPLDATTVILVQSSEHNSNPSIMQSKEVLLVEIIATLKETELFEMFVNEGVLSTRLRVFD